MFAFAHVGVDRPETMEHALQCLARLIRALLGPTAVAANKLACGRTLEVLGVGLPWCACVLRVCLVVGARLTSACPSGGLSANPRNARCANGAVR